MNDDMSVLGWADCEEIIMMLDCFALVALTGTECETNKIFDSSYSPLLRTASYLFRLISHKSS